MTTLRTFSSTTSSAATQSLRASQRHGTVWILQILAMNREDCSSSTAPTSVPALGAVEESQLHSPLAVWLHGGLRAPSWTSNRAGGSWLCGFD